MIYHSTRSELLKADSAAAVLEGLAPDGGLYVPAALPDFDWKACLQGSAMDMANAILSALLPHIPNMQQLVTKAYTGKFTTDELTPTVSVGDFGVLELFHGPTSAFTDVALCMLPQLLTAARAVKSPDESILILTATPVSPARPRWKASGMWTASRSASSTPMAVFLRSSGLRW